MKFRKVIIVTPTFVLGLIVVMSFRSPAEKEPACRGMTLSGWLIQYSMDDVYNRANLPNDEIAIRAIGTNALPFLLKMARSRDSFYREKLLALCPVQLRIREGWFTETDYARMAADGFSILGIASKEVVNAFVEDLESGDPIRRAAAAQNLGSIGPAAEPAVPTLVRHFNDADALTKDCVRTALGSINKRPELVLPLLIADIMTTNRSDGSYVASLIAVGSFKQEAQSAIPALRVLMSDPDQSTRFYASNALAQIAPQNTNSAR